MRPSVTPTKTVNLAQLATELGGAGLCRNEETGEIAAAEGAAVTQRQLEDAVAAHAAVFPPDPDDDLAARLEALAAKQSPTVKEVLNALLGKETGASGAVAGRPT